MIFSNNYREIENGMFYVNNETIRKWKVKSFEDETSVKEVLSHLLMVNI